ncbi:MAG TPA: isoprenylcysteine carboxylmethyltransferase family protein [Devosia sp.]|nr:isoprenylcysteine carboxylmethyltransferase family protein [Devosia sp.]
MGKAWDNPDVRVATWVALRTIGGLVLMGWGLFWAANTIAWPQAWWFLILFGAQMAAAFWYLWRVNPEIFPARRRFGIGTGRWDYVFFALIVGSFIAVLHVAGFDHRLGWAPMPVWVAVLGNVVVAVGYGLIVWAQGVNRHFEPTVRIQSDRDHRVVATGPYALVRHPGYVGGSLVVIGMALALGSLWALLPAAVLVATLVLRTVFEERVLVAELPGYADYTQRVRYRWVQGVW